MSNTQGLVADTITFSSVDGPGNRFVVFLQGCNFDCVACHNPSTIPRHVPHARTVTAADLLEEVRGPAPYLSGVTVSGGEATLQAAFVVELFRRVKADRQLGHLTTFVDTNGAAEPHVWDELAPVMDGALVDLKCLDPDIHRTLTGQDNGTVLASIERLAVLHRLFEVRLLLVPGINDNAMLLERTALWLHGVDPDLQVRLIGFRRHGTRAAAAGYAEPTAAQLARCAAVLTSVGLSRVVMV